MRQTCEHFGFREVTTPAFEHTELFALRSGPSIVDQMYTFKDRGGRSLALRPELTAPVMRYYLSELRSRPRPLKVYYFGNCFRYERPQRGRLREFWTLGAEVLGSDEAEAECIALSTEVIKQVGLKFQLRIGQIDVLRAMLADQGIKDEKAKEAMVLIDKHNWDGLGELLGEGSDELVEVLLAKTLENVDAKDASGALDRLKKVLSLLPSYGVTEYELDLSIARGLDYYKGIVWEIDAPSLGAERQICGGGSYALSEVLGGEPMGSTGFGIGFDRVMLALGEVEIKRPSLVYVIPIGDQLREKAIQIATELRSHGLGADTDLMRRSLGKNLEYANAIGADRAVIIGPRELEEGKAMVRDLQSGAQTTMPIEGLVEFLTKNKIQR